MFKNTAPAPEGQPQHQTKLVIRGAKSGSKEYHTLAEKFAGQLKAFHVKQQQNYRLSGGLDVKTRRDLRGAKATYQNVQGQETIYLDVDTPSEEKEEKVAIGEPWEFALIEFTLDSEYPTDFKMAAFLVDPELEELKTLTEDNFLPIQGVARSDDQTVVDNDPILAFGASVGLGLGTVAGGKPVLSLRVDLRRYPYTTVEIAIYGYIKTFFEAGASRGDHATLVGSDNYGWVDPDTGQIGDGISGGVGGTGTNTPGFLANLVKSKFRSPVSADAFVLARAIATFPELASLGLTGIYSTAPPFAVGSWGNGWSWADHDPPFGSGPYRWAASGGGYASEPSPFAGTYGQGYILTTTFWGPGIVKTQRALGTTISNNGGAFLSGTAVDAQADGALGSCDIRGYDWTSYWVPTWKYEKPVPMTLAGIFVQNGNPWREYSTRQHETNASYLWENPASYPDRPPMKPFGAEAYTMPAQENPLPDLGYPVYKFGFPLIGTLKLDTRGGSMKFVQA